jgi:hypothetical protein
LEHSGLFERAEGQEDRGPKPLAFGSIDYNYNPQQ